MKPQPAGTIDLSLNENPRRVSPKVVEAVSAAALKLNVYPLNQAWLADRIARYLDQGLTARNILLGHGGVDVLERISRAFIHPDDEAIIPIPAFPVYLGQVKARGGKPVFVEADHRYCLDVEGILSQVTPRTRIVYVTSPHNPMGSVLTQAEMDHLMANLPERVLVVFDEVYWHFGTHPERARAFKFVHDQRRVLILHSFSKAFGMAGLRLGYGIASEALINEIRNLSSFFLLSHLTLAAGAAILEDRETVDGSIAMVREQRSFLHQGLSALDAVEISLPSEANFVTFRPRVDSQWVVNELLRRGIGIRELGSFTMPGWLRVSVGMPEQNRQFLDALAETLDAASR